MLNKIKQDTGGVLTRASQAVATPRDVWIGGKEYYHFQAAKRKYGEEAAFKETIEFFKDENLEFVEATKRTTHIFEYYEDLENGETPFQDIHKRLQNKEKAMKVTAKCTLQGIPVEFEF